MDWPLAKALLLVLISMPGWKGLPLVAHVWVPHDSPVWLFSSSLSWEINPLYYISSV